MELAKRPGRSRRFAGRLGCPLGSVGQPALRPWRFAQERVRRAADAADLGVDAADWSLAVEQEFCLSSLATVALLFQHLHEVQVKRGARVVAHKLLGDMAEARPGRCGCRQRRGSLCPTVRVVDKARPQRQLPSSAAAAVRHWPSALP